MTSKMRSWRSLLSVAATSPSLSVISRTEANDMRAFAALMPTAGFCQRSASRGTVIYPGEPERFIAFDVRGGLEQLRKLIAQAKTEGFGIVLRGDVGITSHFGDVFRRNEIPSRLERDTHDETA